MHCYLATCYKVTGGVRCISNFFVCAYLDVNVNLVTVAVQPTGGKDMFKGKEYIFWKDFFLIIIIIMTSLTLVGQALQLIAACTVVLYLDVSADLIQGQKGQIPQGAAA